MTRRRIITALVASLAAASVAWAAFAPMRNDDRDERFTIPKGTWAKRMGGDKVEILPGVVKLTLGIKDVLVLQNDDDVPQAFGPVLMMPGQGFRLPFEMASTYQFACTAHASGQMTIDVAPGPAAGWERLAWRARSIVEAAT